MDNTPSLFHLTFLFWVILDSPGNVPLFVSLIKHFDAPTQRKIILREMGVALAVLVLAFFFGNEFFAVLGISTNALRIAGGVILFILAIRMIFSRPEEGKEGAVMHEPFVVPLAVPAVAGPGIIATVALYSSQLQGQKEMVFLALVLAWLASLPILLFASFLKQLLGSNGLVAAERLLGYLVVLISAQMVLEGFSSAFLS